MTPPKSTNQQKIINQALEQSNPTGWFEPLYVESQGDATLIPWVRLAPHAYLQDWLNTNSPPIDKHSALVIGCGLGDDAEALAEKGFKVTAFDISPTAIAWCKQRFPNSRVNYLVADLFTPPTEWLQTFDFVLESRTIQALPLNIRTTVIQSVVSFIAVGGTLLVITGCRSNIAPPNGPPWHLFESELNQFLELGLEEVNRLYFHEAEKSRVRIEYRQLANVK